MEHRDKAKDSLIELSSGIVCQLVSSPWQKLSSAAGLELAILLPQPKCWDYSNMPYHLATLDSLISIFLLFKED